MMAPAYKIRAKSSLEFRLLYCMRARFILSLKDLDLRPNRSRI